MFKTDRYIVPGQPKGELPYHDIAREREELGPSYSYMQNSWVTEADMYLDVVHVRQVPPDFKSYIDIHKHPVSQVYAIGPGLICEVTLEGERHEVTGPAGVFIPSGMMHSICPLRGNGYLVVAIRGGEYV